MRAPAKSKYRNVKTKVDGITFDSKAEARRWRELQLLERGGLIENIKRQVRFPLVVNGDLICHYVADFTYTDRTTGKEVREDVKGARTAVYAIKRKFMAAIGLPIVEVKA